MTNTRMVLTMAAALALGACDAATVAGPQAGGGRALFDDVQCPPGEICWEPPPPDTTTPTPRADFRYYSAIYVNLTGYGSTASKQVSMGGRSESIRNVAALTLDTRFYYSSLCVANPPQVARQTRSGNGSPVTLTTAWNIQYPTSSTRSFGVRSTHSFTAAPGATGGGSFNSSDGLCY